VPLQSQSITSRLSQHREEIQKMADLLHRYHGTASFLRHLRTLLTQIEDFLKRVEVSIGWLTPVYMHMHLFSCVIPVCLVNESHQLSCIYWRDYLYPLHGPHFGFSLPLEGEILSIPLSTQLKSTGSMVGGGSQLLLMTSLYTLSLFRSQRRFWHRRWSGLHSW